MKTTEATATKPPRKRKLVTPLERGAVAHLQNAAELLGENSGVEYIHYEGGTLEYASFGGEPEQNRAKRRVRRDSPCEYRFCTSYIIPPYYLTRGLCEDCRLWINVRHAGQWGAFEASHRFPDVEHCVHELLWRFVHDIPCEHCELSVDEAVDESAPHPFTVAADALRVRHAELDELPLPTETYEGLQDEINAYRPE